jgi:hypothetical protein
VRGEGEKKGPRFSTGAPSFWRGFSMTAPRLEDAAEAADKNDRSSTPAPTATASTREGALGGPFSAAEVQKGKELRDQAQPATEPPTRRTVAEPGSKACAAPETPLRRSDHLEAQAQPPGTPDTKPSPATRTGRFRASSTATQPSNQAGFAYGTP